MRYNLPSDVVQNALAAYHRLTGDINAAHTLLCQLEKLREECSFVSEAGKTEHPVAPEAAPVWAGAAPSGGGVPAASAAPFAAASQQQRAARGPTSHQPHLQGQVPAGSQPAGGFEGLPEAAHQAYQHHQQQPYRHFHQEQEQQQEQGVQQGRGPKQRKKGAVEASDGKAAAAEAEAEAGGRHPFLVGVNKCKKGWRAKLKPGKDAGTRSQRTLGTFATQEEAARAYDRGMLVRQLQHKDKVHIMLNFPLAGYLRDPDPEVSAAAARVKARIDARQAEKASQRAQQRPCGPAQSAPQDVAGPAEGGAAPAADGQAAPGGIAAAAAPGASALAPRPEGTAGSAGLAGPAGSKPKLTPVQALRRQRWQQQQQQSTTLAEPVGAEPGEQQQRQQPAGRVRSLHWLQRPAPRPLVNLALGAGGAPVSDVQRAMAAAAACTLGYHLLPPSLAAAVGAGSTVHAQATAAPCSPGAGGSQPPEALGEGRAEAAGEGEDDDDVPLAKRQRLLMAQQQLQQRQEQQLQQRQEQQQQQQQVQGLWQEQEGRLEQGNAAAPPPAQVQPQSQSQQQQQPQAQHKPQRSLPSAPLAQPLPPGQRAGEGARAPEAPPPSEQPPASGPGGQGAAAPAAPAEKHSGVPPGVSPGREASPGSPAGVPLRQLPPVRLSAPRPPPLVAQYGCCKVPLPARAVGQKHAQRPASAAVRAAAPAKRPRVDAASRASSPLVAADVVDITGEQEGGGESREGGAEAEGPQSSRRTGAAGATARGPAAARRPPGTGTDGLGRPGSRSPSPASEVLREILRPPCPSPPVPAHEPSPSPPPAQPAAAAQPAGAAATGRSPTARSSAPAAPAPAPASAAGRGLPGGFRPARGIARGECLFQDPEAARQFKRSFSQAAAPGKLSGAFKAARKQAAAAAAAPAPRKPPPEKVPQAAWHQAAMAWRQKNNPTQQELNRAAQERKPPTRPRAFNPADAAAAERAAAADARAAGQRQQQASAPQQPVPPPVDIGSLPEGERRGRYRDYNQQRVAGCSTFAQVLRVFKVPCEAGSVKEGYKRAVRMYHPDSNSKDRLWATPEQKVECEEIMKIINERKPATL